MKSVLFSILICVSSVAAADTIVATGDLGLVVERAKGSLLLVNQSERAAVGRIDGLGDLSHASLVYSPDERFAYVFGRDGGLSKVDIITQKIVGRVMQAGNAIGGAISDDGSLVAVSNYQPGGVRVFDADSLEMLADIPLGPKPSAWSTRRAGALSLQHGMMVRPGSQIFPMATQT